MKSVPDSAATKYDRNAAHKNSGQKYLGIKNAVGEVDPPFSRFERMGPKLGRHITKIRIKVENKKRFKSRWLWKNLRL